MKAATSFGAVDNILKSIATTLHFIPVASISNRTISILISVVSATNATYCCCIVVYVMLLIFSFVETIQKMTQDLYQREKVISFGINIKHDFPFRIQRKEKMFTNTLKISTKQTFKSCYQQFRTIEMLMRLGNMIISKFLVALTCMGALAVTLEGYVVIMMYKEVPLLIYVPCLLMCLLALSINFVLFHFAATPNKESRLYQEYWKRRLRSGEYLQLLACPEIGYSFGPLRNVSDKTGLITADVTVNGIATLCLMLHSK